MLTGDQIKEVLEGQTIETVNVSNGNEVDGGTISAIKLTNGQAFVLSGDWDGNVGVDECNAEQVAHFFPLAAVGRAA